MAQKKTLAELARYVEGKVIGDGDVEIARVAPIDEAAPGEIAFLTHPRYQKFLNSCRASAVIIGADVDAPNASGKAFLQARDPYVAFAKILQLFNPPARYDPHISPLAHIEPSARLQEDVKVFAGAYVGREATVGKRALLFPGVFLGDGVAVGDDCVLHPNVVVREKCRIGSRVILHAGVVIGSDGFGYAGSGAERLKIPQVGTVEIGDDVEIGANTTVDRATLGKTIIGRGTKIDNLVQIAHNVVIGEN
jgi:UDP-3-O-[3-hydroxymyristoyl] glucosamine N-acyltransferase